MTTVKPLVLAAAIVAALSSVASAATTHRHQRAQETQTQASPTYGNSYYDDSASGNFQDQFKNTY